MTLYTKCIHDERSTADGLRICITRRLTQNDGQTPVLEWVQGKTFDYWIPIIAPPQKLVGSWYRQEITWEKFRAHYLNYIWSAKIRPHLDLLADIARQKNITILCVEKSPENCHKKILAEECKRTHPELEVIIK